jgi:pimeloyl-ACP methyl ester carboxylesterase
VLLVVATLTSGALGGVAEAFVAREISQSSTSISQSIDPSTQNPLGLWTVPRDLAPVAAASVSARTASTPLPESELRALTGSVLLQQLSLLPQRNLAAFVKDNPTSIHKLVVSPPHAATVGRWWGALTSSGKASFAASAPELVGNLDGIPYTVRDKANRAYLSTAIASARKSLNSGIGRAELVGERHHLEILEQIQRTLTVTAKEPSRQLLTLDPTGDARAAVVVGNLQTANYVNYLVPGMFFTVQGQMYDWTTIAQNLYQQQDGWLKLLAKSDPSYVGKTTATVAWIGYTTPDALDIASLDNADQAADFLGDAIQGVHTVRAGDEPYVTVVAHSYGSTAAMMELAKGNVSVDALAMIGSPGSATQKASELAVKNDNVYVGEAAWDPVVNTAFYGSDPGSASFGAHTMDVAGGKDAITGKTLAPAIGHLGYFGADTQAMRNLALIGLGQDALVTNGTIADASRTLPSK